MRPRGPGTMLAWAAVALIGAIAGAVLLWKGYAGSQQHPPRELLAGGNEPPAPRVAPELESLDRGAAWDDSRIPNLIIRGARDYLPPAQPGADVSALVPAHKP